jgi:predicted lysophospholipase L1 biosynthesis ABC-type transport system permease subunit
MATKKRKREYTIYATHRGGDFTTRSVAYSAGTHRWIYTVYATSIRQAYALAAKEALAADARMVGVRTFEQDWWHGGAANAAAAEAAGLRFVAPYLKQTAPPSA